MDNHSSYVRSGNRGSNNSADERNIDLSLRLGLPYKNENENHVNPIVPDSNRLSNFDFINPYVAHQQLVSESKMINGGGQTSINVIGMMNMSTPNAINYEMGSIGNAMEDMNLNPSSLPWPSQQIGTHNNYYLNNNGSLVGVPIVPLPQYSNNFNYGDQTMNTVSSGSSSSSYSSSSSSTSRRKESRRHHTGTHNGINKRCTNINCNTNDTPMWRKGPLGPKTLCNACGIKYRKEAEQKRAREAERNSNA